MNFNQWKGHAAKGAVSKLTYICGDQHTLTEIVVNDIKTILDVPITDYIEIDASIDNTVWQIASQYPLDEAANRLVVVRNADKLNDWQQMYDWILYSKGNTSNYIVFVSYKNDAPAVFNKGKKTSYVDHIELIRTKGKFIKCSQPNDDDLVSWAMTYGLDKKVAEFLVERTSGDTTSMFNIFRKLIVWDRSPTIKAISLLCNEQALDSFADYLIVRDKKNAYLALQSTSYEDRVKSTKILDYRLDTLMEIGKLVRKRMYAGDIAATTGIKIYLVKQLIPVVKDYDFTKIKQCRQILALVDGALRDGVKVGVWETLITLW